MASTHVLFEEDGAFKAGTVLADAGASLQVEAASGKRTKVKSSAVMLRFPSPSPTELMDQAQRAAEGLDGARLGQAGQAFEQHVAVGQQRDQQRLDHGGLADHGLAHPVTQRREGRQRGGAHCPPIRRLPPA